MTPENLTSQLIDESAADPALTHATNGVTRNGTVNSTHTGHNGRVLEPADLETLFRELTQQWRRDTGHLSSITQKSIHPAYQRIIGLGPDVLPLILQELEAKPGHWFWALAAITGAEDPTPPEDAGVLPKMAAAWLQLAEARGWRR